MMIVRNKDKNVIDKCIPNYGNITLKTNENEIVNNDENRD